MSVSRYCSLRGYYPGSAASAPFTPASLPGLVGGWEARQVDCDTDGAVDFTAASTQKLIVTSPADLSISDYITVAAWVRQDSLVDNTVAVGKWAGTANEYLLWMSGTGASARFNFTVKGTSQTNHDAATFGAPSTDTWYLVVGQFDSVAQKVYISVNGGTRDEVAHTGGLNASDGDLGVGAYPGAGGHMDGRVQCAGVWSRVISEAEIDSLYASGSGMVYDDLTAGLKTSLVSWWNLHESSGARADSHGSNHLTAVNSPGVAAGVATGPVQDRAPVKTWTTRWGSLDFTSTPIASNPLWIESGQNGEPVIRGDVVDDFMEALAMGAVAQPLTIFIASTGLATSGAQSLFDSGSGSRVHYSKNGNKNTLSAGNALQGQLAMAQTFRIHTFVVNGAASLFRLNGVQEASGAAGANAMNNMVIFSNINKVLGGPGTDIASVIVQGALATDDEIASTEAFLNTKYAAY